MWETQFWINRKSQYTARTKRETKEKDTMICSREKTNEFCSVFFVETLKRENIILCAKWMRQTNKQKSYTFRGNLGVKNIGKEECWRSAKKVMLLHPIPSKNKMCMFTILSSKKSKKKMFQDRNFALPLSHPSPSKWKRKRDDSKQ